MSTAPPTTVDFDPEVGMASGPPTIVDLDSGPGMSSALPTTASMFLVVHTVLSLIIL